MWTLLGLYNGQVWGMNNQTYYLFSYDSSLASFFFLLYQTCHLDHARLYQTSNLPLVMSTLIKYSHILSPSSIYNSSYYLLRV